jgi:glucose/mannose transport system permease protein
MSTVSVTPPAAALPEAPRRARPRRPGSTGIRAARFAALLAFVVLFLIPLYVLLATSFKPLSEADPSRAWSLPHVWTLEGWRAALDALAPALWNSVQLAVTGSVISAILGSMNGYVLSKWRFPYADAVFTAFLFGMFIPYQAVMIPLVQLMTKAHLIGGIPGLILAHVVYGIPICTLIFRNYYTTIPDELVEAARVDGAGMLRTYASVVLPNSAPAFAVVLIWQFTSMWNDFLFAVFLTAPDSWPATVRLNNIAGSMVVPYSQQMAAAVLASLPTLLVYVLLGRYFMRGLMAGALKG